MGSRLLARPFSRLRRGGRLLAPLFIPNAWAYVFDAGRTDESFQQGGQWSLCVFEPRRTADEPKPLSANFCDLSRKICEKMKKICEIGILEWLINGQS